MIGIPALFITQKYRVSLPQIGFRWPPEQQHLIVGFKYGLILFLVVLVLQYGVMALLQMTAGPGTAKEVEDITSKLTAEKMLKDNRSGPMFFTMLIVAGVMAPFAEEMFFRGFLYNAAKRRLGIAGGAILSGVVFAAVHFGPLAVLLIIPMGIALALAYERSRSLWVPIAMHATNNFIAVTVTYLMPNL
jgi:membrane protease YdiL (CAAX protease family)